ncbi:MAG: LysR family transcriptional regulator [Alphaproteobacteria bacterium]|nr:LysR family transcriptional regulator [Alphaproteobacteria bacterium]
MDLFQSMRVFSRVAEVESFSGAARDLAMSKAAASKHVRALEDRLGVRLLNRTTRRLSLTEEGRLYYEWCRRIQADLSEADSSVARQHGEPRGTLRVNAPMSFGIRHLSSAVPDFLARYADLAVDLTLNDRYVDLVDEGYDMAIRIGSLEDSSLVARKLAVARRVLCAAPAYLERHGRPQEAQDLARHNCLSYSYARTNPGVWRLRGPEGEVSVQVRGNLDANNGDVIRAATLAGSGIAWQPSFIVGDDIRAGRLEHVLPRYGDEIGIHAVYPQTRYLSAKVRAFVDYLAGRFGGRPSWEEFA